MVAGFTWSRSTLGRAALPPGRAYDVLRNLFYFCETNPIFLSLTSEAATSEPSPPGRACDVVRNLFLFLRNEANFAFTDVPKWLTSI